MVHVVTGGPEIAGGAHGWFHRWSQHVGGPQEDTVGPQVAPGHGWHRHQSESLLEEEEAEEEEEDKERCRTTGHSERWGG